MNQLRRFWCCLLPVLAGGLAPVAVHACSCTIESGQASTAVAEPDSVAFVGDVVSIRSPLGSSNRTITFYVIEGWKGVTGTQLSVTTGLGGGDCGVGFGVGERWVVFGRAAGSVISVGICSPTSSLESDIAQARTDLLGLGYSPLPLTDGPDPDFPPSLAAPIIGFCGAGVSGAALTSIAALGFVVLRPSCNGSGRRSKP